jgi:hypothetical protein
MIDLVSEFVIVIADSFMWFMFLHRSPDVPVIELRHLVVLAATSTDDMIIALDSFEVDQAEFH